MKKNVTSHDVAALAGVSRSTVSLVLNRSLKISISKETRQRVLEAARKLGYTPNSAAQMLVRGNTHTIGLVISDEKILPSDAFIPQVFAGISQVTKASNYRLLIQGLDEETGWEPIKELIVSRRIDGIVFINPSRNDADIAELIEEGFPIVLAGSISHPNEHSVNADSAESTKEAVDQLVSLGHRNIGSITFGPKKLAATRHRLEDLRNALALHNLKLDEENIEYGEYSAQSGHDAALRFFERNKKVTAILAGNDTIALGIISAASLQGISVPGDLSVVGFDDLPFSPYLIPPLTTIHMDPIELGMKTAEMLIKLLHGEKVEERQVRLPTRLIVRKSWAAPH